MKNFNLHILAAERDFFEGECVSLIVPLTDGLYGIQANHKSMVSAISQGPLTMTLPDGKKIEAVVSQGILIIASNEVRLLVDTIETEEEVLANAMMREAEDAKEAELQKKSIQEFKKAQIWIARENIRLARRRRDDRY